MPIKKETTVKKTQRSCLYAVLLSLILLLPALSVQATSPAQSLVMPRSAGSDNLTVTILKPLKNAVYFRDNQLTSMTLQKNNSFIYGSITVSAQVNGTNISSVQFLVDGKVKVNRTSNVTAGIVNFSWAPIILIGIYHNLSVVVRDAMGNNASASINVTKWRFHVLPALVVVAAMMPSILPRTTIRGIVFNIHKHLFGYTFFAIYVHYRSTSLFNKQKGSIILKRVHVGPSISMHMFNISPLRLARISATFLGTFN